MVSKYVSAMNRLVESNINILDRLNFIVFYGTKKHLNKYSLVFEIHIYQFKGTITQQTFVLMKKSWRCLEDVFCLRLYKMSSRRLDQDEYIHLTYTSLEDVFKTSWSRPRYSSWSYVLARRLQYVFKTSYENVFKTSSRSLAKASSRRLQNVFKTSSKRFQDVLSS